MDGCYNVFARRERPTSRPPNLLLSNSWLVTNTIRKKYHTWLCLSCILLIKSVTSKKSFELGGLNYGCDINYGSSRRQLTCSHTTVQEQVQLHNIMQAPFEPFIMVSSGVIDHKLLIPLALLLSRPWPCYCQSKSTRILWNAHPPSYLHLNSRSRVVFLSVKQVHPDPASSI